MAENEVVKNITVNLDVASKKFDEKVDKAISSTKSLEKAYEDTTKTVLKADGEQKQSLSKLQEKLAKSTEEITKAKAEIQELTKAKNAQKQAVRELSESIDKNIKKTKAKTDAVEKQVAVDKKQADQKKSEKEIETKKAVDGNEKQANSVDKIRRSVAMAVKGFLAYKIARKSIESGAQTTSQNVALANILGYTGGSTDEIKALQSTFERMGFSADSANASIQDWAKTIADLEYQGIASNLAKGLGTIGVQLKDSKGQWKEYASVMLEAGAIARKQVGERKAVQFLMSRTGMSLEQATFAVHGGPRYGVERKRVATTASSLKSAQKAKDAWERVELALERIGQVWLDRVLPAITTVINFVADKFEFFEKISKRGLVNSLGDYMVRTEAPLDEPKVTSGSNVPFTGSGMTVGESMFASKASLKGTDATRRVDRSTVAEALKSSGTKGIGVFQLTRQDISEGTKALGLSSSDAFTQDVQSQIFFNYVLPKKNKGLSQYLKGQGEATASVSKGFSQYLGKGTDPSKFKGGFNLGAMSAGAMAGSGATNVSNSKVNSDNVVNNNITINATGRSVGEASANGVRSALSRSQAYTTGQR